MSVRKAQSSDRDLPRRGESSSAAPYTVDYVGEHRVVVGHFRGHFTAADAWQGLQAIRTAVAAHPVEGVLIDVRASDYTPTVEEVTGFAAEFVSFLGRRRLAVLTSLLVHYGLGRMMVQHAQARGIDAEVFIDEHEAIDWLHSPDTR
jgi:uncharacterized protein (UPF0303 family)